MIAGLSVGEIAIFMDGPARDSARRAGGSDPRQAAALPAGGRHQPRRPDRAASDNERRAGHEQHFDTDQPPRDIPPLLRLCNVDQKRKYTTSESKFGALQ